MSTGLLALALMAGWRARSHAQDVLKVVVLSAPQTELAKRIRGQTSDLPVVTRAIAESAPSREVAEQLAQRHAADVVLWVEPHSEGSLDVVVWNRAGQTLKRRRVVAQEHARGSASSAIAEITALVVRSELSSLLERRDAAPSGQPLPPRDRQITAENADAQTAKNADAQTTARASPSSSEDDTVRSAETTAPSGPAPAALQESAESASPHVQALLGYRIAWPVRWTPTHAGVLALRLTVGSRLRAGLHGSASGPSRLRTAPVELTLRRYGVGGHALLSVHRSSSLDLSLGASAELGVYRRSAKRRDTGLTPTRDQTAARPVVGPTLELTARLFRRSFLVLAAGANFVIYPTRYQIETMGERAEIERVSWLEPWLGLSFMSER